MAASQPYDEAMYAFSREEYALAAERLEAILAVEPSHFEAQLALGMAYCRLGDLDRAIREGHKAEALRPNDQLAHTNLSLFYVKTGDKVRAEHHGLQSRIASWRGNLAPPDPAKKSPTGLEQSKPTPPRPAIPDQFPDMPWKKPAKAAGPGKP
jgi:tetratricopeptide (TPR) repeat protein